MGFPTFNGSRLDAMFNEADKYNAEVKKAIVKGDLTAQEAAAMMKKISEYQKRNHMAAMKICNDFEAAVDKQLKDEVGKVEKALKAERDQVVKATDAYFKLNSEIGNEGSMLCLKLRAIK